MIFPISLQESAAPGLRSQLLSAVEPVSGSDPRAKNLIIRSGLGDAADSLTLDEIAALRRDYSSDVAASTVSLNLEETSSPTWVLASAITLDPVFGFADHIRVSEVVPDHN